MKRGIRIKTRVAEPKLCQLRAFEPPPEQNSVSPVFVQINRIPILSLENFIKNCKKSTYVRRVRISNKKNVCQTSYLKFWTIFVKIFLYVYRVHQTTFYSKSKSRSRPISPASTKKRLPAM